MCGVPDETPEKNTETWPAITSIIAGPPPL
jgi:hypothetical protein